MAWTFAGKTKFTGFDTTQQATILATMQTAYDGSATAKTMFDTWINAGNIIDIAFVPSTFAGDVITHELKTDLDYLYFLMALR
jgi:hypothetical protein